MFHSIISVVAERDWDNIVSHYMVEAELNNEDANVLLIWDYRQ